uniref:AB hydrolase-1 domain-containing protein n=1 Tax=Glossina palpalis gambiensis TaxID=67801 RepID=A0A1B0B5G4_9MUSC
MLLLLLYALKGRLAGKAGEEYKWDKISLVGHSLSSQNAFVIAGLFPHKIDLMIGLDCLTPFTSPAAKIIHQALERLEHSLKIAKHLRGKSEPPVYDWDQLVKRFHEGVRNSIILDACKFILEQLAKNKYLMIADLRLIRIRTSLKATRFKIMRFGLQDNKQPRATSASVESRLILKASIGAGGNCMGA